MHFEPKTLAIIGMRNRVSWAKPLFSRAVGISDRRSRCNGGSTKNSAGGGAMMDIGIYSVNGARYMVGEDPIWSRPRKPKPTR